MIRRFILILPVILLITMKLNGQSIDDLMLSEKEIPKGYSLTDNCPCMSIQVCMFYAKPEVFEIIIGELKSKQHQGFIGGCIMYFEFEDEFKREDFLRGFLWGEAGKPTKKHPEEIYSKGKFLIIWSFPINSKIVKASKKKIKKILK